MKDHGNSVNETLNAQQGRPHQLVGVEPTACSKPPTNKSCDSNFKHDETLWWLVVLTPIFDGDISEMVQSEMDG